MTYLSIGTTVTHIVLVFVVAVTLVAQQGPSLTKKSTADDPQTLAFNEFFESTQGLKPSNKLMHLKNKRVRLTGYMAQMENELEGSFFLVPRPVFCDEEGAGTADIPPDAVLVIVPFRVHQKIPFVQGLLEVTGVLEVGNKEEDGLVSSIRLIMDQPTKNTTQFSRSRKISNN